MTANVKCALVEIAILGPHGLEEFLRCFAEVIEAVEPILVSAEAVQIDAQCLYDVFLLRITHRDSHVSLIRQQESAIKTPVWMPVEEVVKFGKEEQLVTFPGECLQAVGAYELTVLKVFPVRWLLRGV